MTNKELEVERQKIRDVIRNAEGNRTRVASEVKRRQQELACIDMVNSLLAYDCRGCKSAEEVVLRDENNFHSYLANYVKELGRERVTELVQDQINDITGIKVSVFTDGDGLSYNEILWKER